MTLDKANFVTHNSITTTGGIMNKLRRLLYRLASLLGDANAVANGKIVERIVRKETTKLAMRGLSKLFKR